MGRQSDGLYMEATSLLSTFLLCLYCFLSWWVYKFVYANGVIYCSIIVELYQMIVLKMPGGDLLNKVANHYRTQSVWCFWSWIGLGLILMCSSYLLC